MQLERRSGGAIGAWALGIAAAAAAAGSTECPLLLLFAPPQTPTAAENDKIKAFPSPLESTSGSTQQSDDQEVAVEAGPEPFSPALLKPLAVQQLSCYLEPAHPTAVRLAALAELYNRLHSDNPALATNPTRPTTLAALAAFPRAVHTLTLLLCEPDNSVVIDTLRLLMEVTEDRAIVKMLMLSPLGLLGGLTQFVQDSSNPTRQMRAAGVVRRLSYSGGEEALSTAAGRGLMKAVVALVMGSSRPNCAAYY